MAGYIDKITASDGTTYNITGVFIASYGTTTFSELTEAFANKRLILAYVSGSPKSYYALTSAGTFYEFRKFSVDLSNNITTYYMDTITCNSSGWDSYRTSISGTTNAGIIQMYAGAATQTITDGIATVTGAPNGWLICDGSELLKSEYSELAAALGNTWGTPSSSEYFKLPDLRGRAPIGTNYVIGDSNVSARAIGDTIGSENIQAHTHGFTQPKTPNHTHTMTYVGDAASNISGTNPSNLGSVVRRTTSSSDTTKWTSDSTGGGVACTGGAVGAVSGLPSGQTTGSQGNMPPSAVVNFIICTGKSS